MSAAIALQILRCLAPPKPELPPRAAPLTDGGYARDSAGRAQEGERMSGNPAVHSQATEIPGVGRAGEGRCELSILAEGWDADPDWQGA